jgi:hypothetical protein
VFAVIHMLNLLLSVMCGFGNSGMMMATGKRRLPISIEAMSSHLASKYRCLGEYNGGVRMYSNGRV